MPTPNGFNYPIWATDSGKNFHNQSNLPLSLETITLILMKTNGLPSKAFNCGPCRARTCDQRIMSPLL